MTFAVKSANIEEKPIILDLIQPYLAELSRLPDEDPDYKDENGIYQYPYLDHYWREKERFPYLLYGDDKIAGFALVRQDGDHWEMSEFYASPQFRRRGLAMTCVGEIFKEHPGEWRISFNKYNNPSRQLWKKLALTLAQGKIEEGESDKNHDFIRFTV